VREFTIVIDDDFDSASQNVAGTTVTSYYYPEQATGGRLMLEYAARALATYNDLFGAYPYAELDLVEAPIAGFGIEYPLLIIMDASYYEDPTVLAEQGFPEGYVEAVVAHEVAHQWWYGLVGNNHYAHAYLDEALANYSTIVYTDRRYGAAEAERALDLQDRIAYAYQYAISGDQVVDQPSDAFPDAGAYFTTVYSKGSLGFAALRAEIGDDAFFAGLRDYAARERFAVATPADLRAAFERASGQELAAFWRAWFESAATRVTVAVETTVETRVETPVGTPAATPAP
jgi:aminopeptidase N